MYKHFVEFQGMPNRVDKQRVRVTLNSRGVMLLNGKAYEAMKSPAAVTLLFDEVNKIIALKPTDTNRKNAFAVKAKDKWNNRTVHTSPFCKHFNIKVERTILFNEVDIDNEGLMKLELTKTTTIGRGRW
jgi:hypothetical protein